MHIKIMSYNTQSCQNYITDKIDFDAVVNAIKECKADIIGLQEIRDESENEVFEAQARILAEKLGFYFYFAEAIRFSGENPYGNALLSRYPIVTAETVLIPDPEVKGYDGYYETRCVLIATIDVGCLLHVAVSHFGLNPDEQINAINTVMNNVREESFVLMGDFNMEPDNPMLQPIKQCLYDTADIFSAPKLSFPADDPQVKLDYIFVSKDLKVSDADIPTIMTSDHRPYVITIEMKD